MKRLLLLAAALVLITPALAVAAGRLDIVAAENFYGDIARQIGGPQVKVTSVLNNPAANPHLFEVSPSVARAVARAQIVIYNGIDYDPWMPKLLEATPSTRRTSIDVARLAGRRPGDNPHIWYDTNAVLAFTKVLARTLASADPGQRVDYLRRLARFELSMQPVQARISALRLRLAGTPVTATEPVFGYMLEALGMKVLNRSFQIAVMNGTEPGASQVAAYENNLRRHRVKLLIYDAQTSDPLTDRLRRLAKASGIPVIAVAETEPPDTTYQDWMTSELDAVGQALGAGHP
ncbi:MAG: metal ABC transporter solute-binding protein, Zn/Mn family [Acidiferrobacterales bacterium]